MEKVILASKSPRRQELLKLIFDEFECIPSEKEEKTPENLPIEKCAEFLAVQKACDIAENHKDSLVIGSDTVVICENRLMGKPKNRQDAFEMLRFLSGKKHKVITGCCVAHGGEVISFSEETTVEFYPLTDSHIEAYLDTGEPFDKAGAYGIQGKGALLVKGIEGDYYNVMGLPVSRLFHMLFNTIFQ